MPPNSPAIWLADSPSAQSFLSSSTRSSVQVMSPFPPSGIAGDAGRIRPRGPASGRTGTLTTWNTGNRTLRYVVAADLDATIGPDSGARVGGTHVHIFCPPNRDKPQLLLRLCIKRLDRVGFAAC